MDGLPSRKYGATSYGSYSKITYGKAVKTHLSRSGWLGRVLWNGEVEERDGEREIGDEVKAFKEKTDRKNKDTKGKGEKEKTEREKKKAKESSRDIKNTAGKSGARGIDMDIVETLEKSVIGQGNETELQAAELEATLAVVGKAEELCSVETRVLPNLDDKNCRNGRIATKCSSNCFSKGLKREGNGANVVVEPHAALESRKLASRKLVDEIQETSCVNHALISEELRLSPHRRGSLRRRSSRSSFLGSTILQDRNMEATPSVAIVSQHLTSKSTKGGISARCSPQLNLRDELLESTAIIKSSLTRPTEFLASVPARKTPKMGEVAGEEPEGGECSPTGIDTPLTIPDKSSPAFSEKEETRVNETPSANDREAHDPLEELLHLCAVHEPVDFTEQITRMLQASYIKKLGEASYSEVFLQRPFDNMSASSSLPSPTVIKLIPFGKPTQCTALQILEEVRITKAMASIKGFIGFHGAYVVRGRFPKSLLEIWDSWDDEIRQSENERPDFYEDNQLFALILLEDGGTDLENFELRSWKEAWWVFWSVAGALSRGERQKEFEHRDLHYGNIVIRRKLVTNGAENEAEGRSPEEMIKNLSISDHIVEKQVESSLDVALIDYTLSRASSLPGNHLSFVPLDDTALFEGKGDYQFDIYRLMKRLFSSPTNPIDPSTGLETIDWSLYNPKTNVYWLHYLVNVLLTKKGLIKPCLRGRNAGNFSEEEKERFADLERVHKLIDYRKKRAGKEREIGDIGSAQDVVAWAVREGILTEGVLD